MASDVQSDPSIDSLPDPARFSAENGSPDTRAVPHKINAEMLVAAPVRDRKVIEIFEALEHRSARTGGPHEAAPAETAHPPSHLDEG